MSKSDGWWFLAGVMAMAYPAHRLAGRPDGAGWRRDMSHWDSARNACRVCGLTDIGVMLIPVHK